MDSVKRLWKDLTPEAQTAWLAAHGEPAYRLKQIREWLWVRRAVTFTEMSNLPVAMRIALDAEFAAFSLNVLDTQKAGDGTRKFLFGLVDGTTVEGVLVPAPRRNTVCVSTQVGCPVRCVFCASGRGGFVRNLTPSEIADQVLFACRELGERVNNVVVMGMGEPLLNLDNLLVALEIIGDPAGLGLGARHVTISTSGIVPGIRRLAEQEKQWNLALSLHATDDEARAQIIPEGHRFPLEEVLAACRDYREKAGRMVTLEYALIRGMNDSSQEIQRLGAIAKDLRAKVNLIPCNRIGGKLVPPDRAEVRRISDQLDRLGVQVSVRKEMGADIDAACGQLRSRYETKPGAIPAAEE